MSESRVQREAWRLRLLLGEEKIKTERSASKRHFHNCPESRLWWAKGSEKSTIFQLDERQKLTSSSSLHLPQLSFSPHQHSSFCHCTLISTPTCCLSRSAKEFFSQNLVNNRHEISIAPPACLESGTLPGLFVNGSTWTTKTQISYSLSYCSASGLWTF